MSRYRRFRGGSRIEQGPSAGVPAGSRPRPPEALDQELPRFLAGLPAAGEPYEPKQDITRELKRIIEEEGYQSAFLSAIARVQVQNVRTIRRIQTLEQYYYFIDSVVMWMPGLRVWEHDGRVLHERSDLLRITQFYYYFNQPTLEALQSPITPDDGDDLTPISRWLRDFAVAWGAFLDTKESATYLDTYKFGPEYNYQDYNHGKVDYETFNEWFSREFTDIDAQRPVARPDDPRVVAYPAESTFVGQWAISTPVPEGQPLPAASSITVKHVEWPIPQLLKDSEYGECFAGGIFAHSFLNVYDYHRQHAPVSGKILEARFIPGQVYLDVELEILNKEQRADTSSDLANAIVPRRYLDAEDPTGYQFVQCRGLMVIESAIGKVAVLPMGMAQVSSVLFVTQPRSEAERDGFKHEFIRLTAKEKARIAAANRDDPQKIYQAEVDALNAKIRAELVDPDRPTFVRKGDMISSFMFGGSDIVMVFEREANIRITSTVNVHYPVRSQYAYSNIAALRPV